MKESRMAPTESFETVTGCRIRVWRKGKGPTLLYLHGSNGASAWLPFMEKLSDRFDVIVPEHPGFGQSDTPKWLDGVGDMAYFYLDFIEQFDLDGIHLVGGSLGGWIAAELAVRDCSRLASLTLIGSAGIHVKGVRKGDMFMWSPDEATRNIFYDQALAEQMLAVPMNEAALLTAIKNRETTAKLAWQPRFYNPDLPKWLHRIQIPTLIVWGAEDRLMPAAYGPAFRELIPNAQLETFKECGHLPQVEKPDLFVSTLTGFTEEMAR
jgi:pimeloyl-ACP methyl ester carboxylesterase